MSNQHSDSERLDWLERMCHVDTPHAPHITVGHNQTVIWDQYDGLTRMGQGKNLREAIDAAMNHDDALQSEQQKDLISIPDSILGGQP